MRSGCVSELLLTTASLLVAAHQRSEWVRHWRSDLWYVPRRDSVRFCMGSFQDALWMRRNCTAKDHPSRNLVDSPVASVCLLGFLSFFSTVVSRDLSSMVSPRLPSFPFLLLLYALLISGALVFGDGPARRFPLPRAYTLQSSIVFLLKIGLIFPVFHRTLVLMLAIDIPPLPLALLGADILLVRWVVGDQRHRCPVCLGSLVKPVRIGTPSETFLEWYGSESMCLRGHGFLQAPEISASYSGSQRWLRLDDSWATFFHDTAGESH